MLLSAFPFLRRAAVFACACLAASSVFAGSYSQNFNTATAGYPVTLGDGSVVNAADGNLTTGIRQVTAGPPVNNALQLMAIQWGGATSSWKLPDLDVGKAIQSFDFNCNVAMAITSATAIPGAGWSVNFGAIPTGDGAGDGGFVMTNGLTITFDLFNNGGIDYPSIQVLANGVSVGNYLAGDLPGAAVTGGTFTLTNPTGNLTTAPIASNATAATVQTAMRAKAGWSTVVVTGNAGGPWTVDHGVTGTYADPTATSTLLPGGSSVAIVNTQDGTATQDETWTITLKGTFPFDVSPAATYHPLAIHWDYSGLNVTYNGTPIFTGLQTPGFVPASGNKLALSTRNESSNTANMFFDDVVVATTPLGQIETGGPIITEFMADNSSTLEDEDTDDSDWIEIFNGHATTANLSGYRLTNVAGNNALWTFPAITIAPYGYVVVYASGKNRVVPTAPLHTNFTLQKEGGYLALIKPDGVTKVSEFTYGPQYQDISYGERGPTRTLGYLNPATPGAGNSIATDQAPGGPAEEVVWSRAGGLITGSPATVVTISAPVAPGSVVRYTTNNVDPTSSSAIYNPASPPAAFSVTSSTNLRARVYTPNQLAGPISSRTFLKIDATLTNYNNSGQVFSSHLPIVVLDSFGVPVDNYTDSGNRPNRYTYAVVIDKDPVTGRASLTSPTVDFQGRSGTHVRGSSSATFPQHQYSWELWDEANNDKKSSILGMPSESDWVIYAPYDDKVLFRNFLVYSRARAMSGGNGFGMRTKFCEVFFNQVAGAAVSYSSYDGVYVIVEKIKRGSDRVNIEKLNSLTTDPTMITGGYVVKHDRTGDGDTVLTTSSGGVEIGSVDPGAWNSAQQNYLTNYFNSFETALNGGNFADPVNGYQKYIDRDTFIDNQWCVEIAKQIDGYRLSQYFWKDRGGKLKNGPVWDYNLSLSNANYNTGDSPVGWYYTVLGGADYAWYPRLHQDTTSASPYELRHWDRYWELRRGLFATANILGEIDSEASTLLNGSTTPVSNSMPALPPTQENAAMRQYRKWPILGTYIWPNSDGYNTRIYFNSNGNATTGEVDWMKNWLTQRLAWIDDQRFIGTVIYRPPNFSSYSGNVNAGSTVTMSAYTGAPPSGYTYATGTVYYTTDGSDPRGTNNAPNSTALAYANPVALNTSATVKARLFNSPNWSPVSVGTFTVNAVPATAANLVVSEMMYDPPAVTSTESAAGYSASDFEYIELLNVGTTNVDLSNVALTNGVTFNFGANNPALLTVPPGGCIVVAGNASAFPLRYGSNPAIKLAGAYSGNLSNSGEQVTLVDASGATIADFTYGIAEPWPVDAHGGTGYSLVLCNPAPNLTSAYYNNGANWRSSGTVNGSPGVANSAAFAGQLNGDTDHDGLSDFFEYATGSNLGSAASRNLPVTSVVPYVVNGVTSNYLTFAYHRNLSADGVHYTVQYSTDLASWASDPSVITYLGTHNNGDGTATVTYRATAPLDGTQPKMFLRLMVSP